MSGPRNWLVVGLGNPDRGDDGIGPAVAAMLVGRLRDADVIARSGDILALLDDWAGYDCVVLIDATLPRSGPGRVHRIDLSSEELPRDLSLSSTHAFGVSEAIALARTLATLPRRVIIYAVEGKNFDIGATMSAEAVAGVEQAADMIARDLGSDTMIGVCAHA